MSTLQLIERILRVADIANRTELSLDELHGLKTELGVDFFDPATHVRMAETNIGNEALEKLLASLSDDDLQRIHALMYAGRDEESAKDVKIYFAERGERREDMERSVAEKRPALRTYLSRSIARAKEEGIDIDTF